MKEFLWPPLSGQPLNYFFLLDLLDFFSLTNWRAVKAKTMISNKSFTISSSSCSVLTSVHLLSMVYIIYLFR